MVCTLKQMFTVKCCFITTDMGCILPLPPTRVLVNSHTTNKYEKSIMIFNVVLYNMGLPERKTQEYREKVCLSLMKNRQLFRIAIGLDEVAKQEKPAYYQC